MFLSRLIFLIYFLIFLIQPNSGYLTLHLNETVINGLKINDQKVIVCKSSYEKKWLNIWAKAYLKVDDVNAIKNLHTGYDLASVEEQLSKWLTYNYLRLFINSSTINMPLYTDYCVGIQSTKPFHLTYHFNSLDLTNLLLFIAGTCIFYSANYLSKKIYIYYVSHVTIGVIGSLLILTLIAHRFLPKKIAAFFVLSSFYLNTYFVVRIKEYLFTYPLGLYLMLYILIAAIVSFSFAYYRGPIKNHRLYDLFKWFLQFVSLLLIFFSSEFVELIIFIMALILLKLNLPSIYQIFNDLKKIYRKFRPKQRRLLTKEEYELEGQVETEKALNELRNYCKSPQFNKWKAMKKMHNASRFAGFIDGEDHVSDDEIRLFENVSLSNAQLTDDESLSDQSIGFDD